MPGVYRRNNFFDDDDGRNETCRHAHAGLARNNLDFLQTKEMKVHSSQFIEEKFSLNYELKK